MKPKEKKEESSGIVLTVGSKYRIKSLESRDQPLITHGTFLGYTAIAHDDGICIELDSSHKDFVGKIRVIPVHVIISIDIMEAVKKETSEKTEAGTMYG
jgi:hypothetical protein